MLVLRKEIKIGIGAGLTILGIAAVYGLIAALSGGGTDAKKDLAVNTGETPNAITDRGNGGGLPPKVDEPDPIAVPPKAVDPMPSRDPFAESNRKDGNTTTDPWATALTSGRVGGDVVKAPAVIKSPTTPKRDNGLIADPISGHEGQLAETLRKQPKVNGATPTTATPAGGKYVVQSGDTFSTIANKVYGSKKYSQALIKANPDVNPSKLRIGREITVPPKEQVASVGGSVGRAAGEISGPIDASRQYRIAQGDTLTRISTKLYGRSTKWEELYEANKATIGGDPAKLTVGTLISLPQKPAR